MARTRPWTAWTSVPPMSRPSPPPPPSPDPIKAEQILTSYPSPGLASCPIPGNDSDTLPGTRFADDPVADPDNPTGPALSADKVQALKDAMKAKAKASLDVLN